MQLAQGATRINRCESHTPHSSFKSTIYAGKISIKGLTFTIRAVTLPFWKTIDLGIDRVYEVSVHVSGRYKVINITVDNCIWIV